MSLSKNQYNSIMRQYDAHQLANQRIHQERQNEIAARIPEWKQLQSEIPSAAAAKVRAMLFPEATQRDHAPFIYRAKDVKERKEALLLQYGYPKDYLDPIYTCPLCKDTGYVNSKKCSCFKRLEAQILYDQSGLSSIIDTENFQNFRTDLYSDHPDHGIDGISPRENIERIYLESIRFVRDFSSSHRNLLFYGTPGVGKTFLSNCIAKELLNRGHSVVYLSATKLFDLCSETAFRSREISDESMAAYEALTECDLLIIDDLGSELMNSFTVSSLFFLINERILSNKSVIISTNLSLQELRDLYKERIFSRLTSFYTFFHIYGEDIRINKKLQR